MNSEFVAKPKKNSLTYIGLFFITLATLMLELVLTRIWSVTSWYHFAFVAISITMFGMTVGALAVHLLPRVFSHDNTRLWLALSALGFSISVVLSFLTHLSIPFFPDKSIVGLYSTILTYLIIAVPFAFSGICVTLALTRFAPLISKMYAADLLGAACGCVLLVAVMKITDGPTAVILCSLFGALSAICFAKEIEDKRLMKIAGISALIIAIFVVGNTYLYSKQKSILRPIWVKAAFEPRPTLEKWNTFSRVTITGDPDALERPSGWGLSNTYPPDRKVRQLYVTIDAYFATPITAFSGNFADVDHLKYDATNIVQYLRPNADVLVLGVGGGRDVLSSLTFDQNKVVGVEINEEVLNNLTKRYADFAGHIAENPKVSLFIDEARSFVARQKDKFDIIQISLIDTQSATGAGAFALSENSMYTVEAWKLFFSHLKPGGIISCARCYFKRAPGEVHRMVSLAREALQQLGIKDTRNNVMVLCQTDYYTARNNDIGIGIVLASIDPFSASDLKTFNEIANKMGFDVLLTPNAAIDPSLAVIASGEGLEKMQKDFPIRLDAPTDNNPFFFYLLRLEDLLTRKPEDVGTVVTYTKAALILIQLLIVVTILSLAFIMAPLLMTGKRLNYKGSAPYMLFFGALGFGFLFIEMSQLQRLAIFLGHPSYSLSVVLFTLLLSSALGSLLTEKVNNTNLVVSEVVSLILLIGSLIGFSYLTSYVITNYAGASNETRILLSCGLLFPLGLFMGTAMPLGLRLAAEKQSHLTAWFWGINGATSVCASVLAVAVAINAGISTSYWLGVGCYVVALIAFVWASRTRKATN